MKELSVGVDLGSQNTALAVFDYEKAVAMPLEIGDDKTLSSCIAVEENKPDAIVGKRAMTRPAKRCEGVLCAYRQMMYGMEREWDAHHLRFKGRWHFSTVEGAEGRRDFDVRGAPTPVSLLIQQFLEAVCTSLNEAARPGGYLQVPREVGVKWVSFGVSVPECFSEAQRALVLSAAKSVVHRALSPDAEVRLVNETLASALQLSTIPPLTPHPFLLIDFGASKLTVSLFEFQEVRGKCTLEEIASKTDVFNGGDEMEFRMMSWCEKRRPFPDSILESNVGLFKLRKEVRSAIKTLTVAEESLIEVDSIVAGKDLLLMLTLEDFERECGPLLGAVEALIDAVLSESASSFPPEVYLVGGCSRIPRIQKSLGRLAANKGSVLRKTLDLDRAVSLGVASTLGCDHLRSKGEGSRISLDPQTPYSETSTAKRVRLNQEEIQQYIANTASEHQQLDTENRGDSTNRRNSRDAADQAPPISRQWRAGTPPEDHSAFRHEDAEAHHSASSNQFRQSPVLQDQSPADNFAFASQGTGTGSIRIRQEIEPQDVGDQATVRHASPVHSDSPRDIAPMDPIMVRLHEAERRALEAEAKLDVAQARFKEISKADEIFANTLKATEGSVAQLEAKIKQLERRSLNLPSPSNPSTPTPGFSPTRGIRRPMSAGPVAAWIAEEFAPETRGGGAVQRRNTTAEEDLTYAARQLKRFWNF